MDILKYGADCTVVGPKALRDRAAAEIDRVRAHYRTSLVARAPKDRGDAPRHRM